MFTLVILPSIGKSKMMLSNVELSSLAKDNFNYRTQTIVKIILSVYIGLTAVTTLLLKLGGMCWFDALCYAMSTCSTCGFGTKNTSVAFFDSAVIESVLIVGMAVAGIHFGLIYATVTRKQNNIFRSEVTRFYLWTIAIAAILIALSLRKADVYPSTLTSLRYALFQTVSCITTTGFAIADCNTWTSFAMLILIFCSIVCACAGSTSGGLKIDRLLLAVKMMRNRLRMQQHPTVAFMMLILAGTFTNTLLGADLMTGFSSAVACAGNVGPGFGEVGSMDNYAALPSAMKLNLTFLMLLGRLEIFGLIQLFFIRWWR